jgi:methylenetetrahydrofolate--tRNA-(uracil-5-)-methyltransferase
MAGLTIIGAGMAGCEAAWVAANAGISVTLYEMKPKKFSPAHHNPDFAELVCSNSLKAARVDSAAGLLKEEMTRLGSLLVPCAKETAVEAGGALAVDRDAFSKLVTEKIRGHKNITVVGQEVSEIPEGQVIVATGPLTSDALHIPIAELTGASLYFYDAAAPIITRDSIDMNKAFFASRYNKGDADYLNCAMDKEEPSSLPIICQPKLFRFPMECHICTIFNDFLWFNILTTGLYPSNTHTLEVDKWYIWTNICNP